VITGSDSRRAIVGAIVGLLYGFILMILSVFAAGAGHPLWLSSAPLGGFGLVAWRVGASPCRRLCDAPQSATHMGSARVAGGAPEEARPHSGSSTVAIRVRAHARGHNGRCVCSSGA
jgi:hypothetical protein